MTVNTKQTIQIDATHLATGEVITDTYWAVVGDYTFHRVVDQETAEAVCTGEAMWRAVELRAVVTRPDGCKLDTPLLSYVPEPPEPQPFVRIAADGYPAWEPGDDLAAAVRALEAYTAEAVRLEIVSMEAKSALLAYTAEHEGVIDWLAYNDAIDAHTAAKRQATEG